MKTVKNITCGIAICLAVLILIYLLTLYVKFKPDEGEVLEDGTVEEVPGKLEQFLDSNVKHEEHLNLIFVLLVSAATGIFLEKIPSLGVVSSTVALCYALTLRRLEELDKFPMTIVILTLIHTVGAIIYAATADTSRSKIRIFEASSSSAAVICQTLALGISSYVVYLQYQVLKTADYVEEMSAEILKIAPRLCTIPHVIESAYRVFQMHGAVEARRLLTTALNEFTSTDLDAELATTINADELSTYRGLVIILLAVIVFSFVCRRHPAIVATLTFVPPIYIFISLLGASFTSATLTLLTLSLVSAMAAFAAVSRKGAPPVLDGDGNEIAFDEWDEDEEHIDDDDHDSDSITDEDADGFDFFIGSEKITPPPPPAPGTPEYEQYVNIENEETKA